MNVCYRKKFIKQLAKLPPSVRQNVEAFVFEQLPDLSSFEASGRFEKLQGYPNCFKARFGNYRLGITVLEDKSIEVVTVLHRKEIYRFFP